MALEIFRTNRLAGATRELDDSIDSFPFDTKPKTDSTYETTTPKNKYTGQTTPAQFAKNTSYPSYSGDDAISISISDLKQRTKIELRNSDPTLIQNEARVLLEKCEPKLVNQLAHYIIKDMIQLAIQKPECSTLMGLEAVLHAIAEKAPEQIVPVARQGLNLVIAHLKSGNPEAANLDAMKIIDTLRIQAPDQVEEISLAFINHLADNLPQGTKFMLISNYIGALVSGGAGVASASTALYGLLTNKIVPIAETLGPISINLGNLGALALVGLTIISTSAGLWFRNRSKIVGTYVDNHHQVISKLVQYLTDKKVFTPTTTKMAGNNLLSIYKQNLPSGYYQELLPLLKK